MSDRLEVRSPINRASVNTPAGGFKIIVGVDYGTTYSGISFVTSNKENVDDIIVVSRWPNHRDNCWKAPTNIAYASENPRLDRNHWGFEVTRGLKQYVWTKLLLDQKTDLTQYDDPLLTQMYGSGFLALPQDKTAKDVATDYLRELYQYLIQHLEKELSPAVVRAMPMECWITMPAIWSDSAQAATRAAALAAGFGSRPGDRVNMIAEPEAAALYALKPYLGPKCLDPLKPGECVLICDCGGGTVDIVTYEILEVTPALKHKERCRGTGAKCGATSIDRRFVQWMTNQFGDAYLSVNTKKRGPGSVFMQAFETVKKSFGYRDDERTYFEVGPIDLDLDAPTPKYDEDEQSVRLSRTEMENLFSVPIKELTKLVDDQAAQLTKINKSISRFVLVGGFGDSPYLNHKLKEWCKKNSVKRFTCPTDCQAAIVKGAALRGLESIRPTSFIAKRHYGWETGMDFRDGLDDEKHAYWNNYQGRKMCRGRMQWVVAKNESFDEDFKITRGIAHPFEDPTTTPFNSDLPLYSCALDHPPERSDHFSVRKEGNIRTVLTDHNEAESRYSTSRKRWVYQWCYDVHVNFRSERGILNFKSLMNDKAVGKVNIDFEY